MIVLGLLGLGLVIGFGLNYLADVLPCTRKISHPICLSCQQPMSWKNYLLLKDCENCGAKRKRRVWAVLFLSIFLLLLIWFYPPPKLGFWVSVVLFTYFGLVAIIDIEHRLILYSVAAAGALIVFPIGLMWNGLRNTLIGGVAGYGIMFVLYLMGIAFNKLMSRLRQEAIEEDALGFGDVNLSGVLGLLLGWPKIGISLLFAVILAGVLSAFYIVGRLLFRSYKAFVPIPYAPFLLVAAVILVYMYR
jgi:prepilin signal peptidase PulO-like enzyme (type II secretory pathway)